MLTRLRTSLFVMLLAGLAACATPTSVPVPTVAIERGITEPFFIQPERMAQKAAIVKSGARIDVVFIGDSITQNYEKPDYQTVWQKYYGARHALNLGYGLDTTGATLWRFRKGELDGFSPKLAIILIGTNDTNLGRSSDQTFAGVVAVVKDVEKRLPDTRILLLGILPSARSEEKSNTDLDVNSRLAVQFGSDMRVTYQGVSKTFLKPVGLNRELYAEVPPEGALHPNPKGQALMAAAIEPKVKLLLGD